MIKVVAKYAIKDMLTVKPLVSITVVVFLVGILFNFTMRVLAIHWIITFGVCYLDAFVRFYFKGRRGKHEKSKTYRG